MYLSTTSPLTHLIPCLTLDPDSDTTVIIQMNRARLINLAIGIQLCPLFLAIGHQISARAPTQLGRTWLRDAPTQRRVLHFVGAVKGLFGVRAFFDGELIPRTVGSFVSTGGLFTYVVGYSTRSHPAPEKDGPRPTLWKPLSESSSLCAPPRDGLPLVRLVSYEKSHYCGSALPCVPFVSIQRLRKCKSPDSHSAQPPRSCRPSRKHHKIAGPCLYHPC
jgi:hypothetical protein